MIQITIRCHPRVPVASEELELWLEQELDLLRNEVPQGTVRLSSLTQHLPSSDIDVGWLIELEMPEDGPVVEGRDLAGAMRDMQLLGLQPTLLTHVTEYGARAPIGDPIVGANGHLTPWQAGGPTETIEP
jgi:hypothetical protein